MLVCVCVTGADKQQVQLAVSPDSFYTESHGLIIILPNTHTHTEHTQSYRAGIRVLYDCTTTYPSPRPLCLSPSLSFSFSLSLFHTPTYKHSHSVETTSVRGYIREVRGRSWQRGVYCFSQPILSFYRPLIDGRCIPLCHYRCLSQRPSDNGYLF